MFSVEHPVCTAASPMTGWLSVGGASVWPVDDYGDETARTQDWLGRTVVKYHRRVATLAGEILAAGLVLTGLDEPCPDAARRGQEAGPAPAPAAPADPGRAQAL